MPSKFQPKAKSFAGLRFLLFLALLVLSAPSAQAIETSPNALRLEDSKAGNILLGAEEANLAAGEVYKTVVLAWGNLAVRGQVDKVIVLSGKATFYPGVVLREELIVMGGAFEALPGAEIKEEKISLRAPGPLWRALRGATNVWRENMGWVAYSIAAASTCLVLWLIGLGFFFLFPALAEITAGRLGKDWGENLLAGLLGAIAVPILMLLLVISLLGIFVLPFYFALLAFAGFVSYLGAALWAGHRLLPPAAGRRINLVGFFLGLAAFQLFWAIGSWAWLVPLALWLLAWGALLRGLRRRRPRSN